MKQKSSFAIGRYTRMTLLGALLGLVWVPVVEAQVPATNAVPVSAAPPGNVASTPTVSPASQALHESYHDFLKGDVDGAFAKVNGVIAADPSNKSAYLLRASFYAQERQWDKATADYNTILLGDPANATVKFDLAELSFMQKKYDEARPGFEAVENDKGLGDFASYKVFLCDLFGGHEDIAAKELAVFNEAAANPSYYFANAAWDLVHNKPNDAAGWLKSAKYIYSDSPQKLRNYSSSLTSLGYLPIHLSSAP